MENNMSYLIEKVEALYPRLDKTYRFDKKGVFLVGLWRRELSTRLAS